MNKLFLAGVLFISLAAGGYYYSKNRPLAPAPQAAVEVAEISETIQLEVLLADGGTVVVKFYADWCGPCKTYAPVFEEVAQEYAGKAKFYKVNVDNAPALSRQIQSIPTTVVFKSGYGVATMGGKTKEELKDFIERASAQADTAAEAQRNGN